jgi:hypothetical protein
MASKIGLVVFTTSVPLTSLLNQHIITQKSPSHVPIILFSVFFSNYYEKKKDKHLKSKHGRSLTVKKKINRTTSNNLICCK